MKVKDIERTANIAWSPKNHYPIYLAAGTAAQQLDASFNTSAALELYTLNLTDPGPDTQLVSSISTDHRFHKIIWSGHNSDHTSGMIVGGCDGGLIQIYDAAKLIKGDDALIGKQEKHTGPVQALDFNNFQQNLLATGAGNSEIFIWDLNNTSTPMSPGAKVQPLEDILSVSWNKQVQHILASTFSSKCVIWDLRKNEPVIKLTDTVSRIRWKVVAWHPEVATQLCLASEEDHSPIIQLWDLRFATSPLKTLENHQRGILSISWCSEDSDLLVSCGKDNRIICWNPNSNHQNGEVLAEVAKTNQWSFDILWCPRNPALIASPNYDGHISIYSLMGGKTQQIQTTNKIADSFPGMDGYVQAPVPQSTAPVSVDLSKPPKWLRRPVGASFGFGGRLITFENDKTALSEALQNTQPGQPAAPIHRLVLVSQVITEPILVKKSEELEQALTYGNFTEYCLRKSEETTDQHKKYIWHFLKANFEQNPRVELLNLIGYNIEDVNKKLSEHVGNELQNNVDGLTDGFSNATRLDDLSSEDPFNAIAKKEESNKTAIPFKINTSNDTDGLITQALLLNNVEVAVGLCLKAKRFADALIIATTGGDELLARTQHKYLEQSEGYVASLISSVVSEDWPSLINNCDVSSWKEALAAALTHASDDDLPSLCEQLGNRLDQESIDDSELANDAQLCYICAGSFEKLVSSWSKQVTKSTNSLQELVELISFLQKAVERQGRQVQIKGALAELLSHYASLLASQGDLATAVTYLGSSNDDVVAALRDRLYIALGQKPSYGQAQEMRQQNRRGSQRQSFSNYSAPSSLFPTNSTNPFHTQNQFNQPPQPPPVAAPISGQFNSGLPAQNQFNTGLPNPMVNTQPWQPQPASPIGGFGQPPKAYSPAPLVPSQGPPPPTQPPRPTSVGSSQGGSSGLPTKKYLLDPSVSSNQYGMLPRNQVPQSSFANSSYSASTINSGPLNPVMPNPTPLGPSVPVMEPTPLVPNMQFNNPASGMPAMSGYGGGMVPHPSIETAQSAYSVNSQSGWNDPPPLHKAPKSKSDVLPSDPITHPIYGSTPAQPLPTNGYSDPSQMYHQNPTNPQMFQPPAQVSNSFSQNYNPGNFNQNAITNVTQQQLQDISGNIRNQTPQPVEKVPIPEEHIHMKTVFDELRNRCSVAANNPQTKRKLDDVIKKLEALYDSLRENKLSPNTLTSLHQIVQLIQNGDYMGGLNLHTQLVSGPDFAQIASFMPGLKVLLQCATQLQVYIR